MARDTLSPGGLAASRILLQGRPGIGKTTVARRLVSLLRERGVGVSGFTTEEIKEKGRRAGFAIEDVDGERTVMAHFRLPGPPKVGRYGVDLPAFERLALPALQAPPGTVVVIDELGKMELASDRFRERVTELFDSARTIVATVQAYRDPFTDTLKARPEVEVVKVGEANRDLLPELLAAHLGRAAPA